MPDFTQIRGQMAENRVFLNVSFSRELPFNPTLSRQTRMSAWGR